MKTGDALCAGRYRLDSVIGRGGMAIVWRARDLQLDRDVAIKVISDVLASDPRFVARFEREARLAAGLNHPNLVKVFDFSVDSERPFLIMEHIRGGTLTEAPPFSLELDSLARELLDALAHIHAAGISHRDIKPANVLLGADGSPRLTDFGIARGDETTGLTQTGQVLGTLRYIAPEVAAGQPATPQSDLYSLGVMLSELSGHRSPALEALLPRLTAHDPGSRPPSAAAALTELEPTHRVLAPTAALGSEAPTAPVAPVAVRLPGRPIRAALGGRPIRPTQAIAAAAVLIGILAIVIAAASGGGGSKPPARSTSIPKPAPAGAPVSGQIDQLEKVVRALPAR